jgi:hypothetical protein
MWEAKFNDIVQLLTARNPGIPAPRVILGALESFVSANPMKEPDDNARTRRSFGKEGIK